MIQTREQLIAEIIKILSNHYYDWPEDEPAANEIADLIATLNEEQIFDDIDEKV